MAGKPCEIVCSKTELPEVMACLTADGKTEDEEKHCLKLHRELFSQSSGRIATHGGIKREGDVAAGRRRHSHGGNRPR